jgi:YidC/Oxa1 family membrane protein insertase
MSDIRRSILWVIFGFSLVLLWDQWQIYNNRPATFFPSSSQQRPVAEATPAAAAAAVDAAVPAATLIGAAPAGELTPPNDAPAIPRETHVITTDVLELTFDSEGGTLVGATLLNHFAQIGRALRDDQSPLTLLTQEGSRVYVAQTGLIGGDFPTHLTPMRLVSTDRSLAPGQEELVVRFESEPVNDVVLVKEYRVRRGAYDIAVRHEVFNQSDRAITPKVYLQLVRDSQQVRSDTPFFRTFTGPVVFTQESKFQKVSFEDVDRNRADFQRTANNGYVAMVQHYFVSAWILGEGVERENFVRRIGNLFAAGKITPLNTLAPGESRAMESILFVGPQYEQVLASLAPGFDLVKDYGWLTILAKPLYWLLEKIHSLVGNWGWAIVLLVVLIKAAFYWLNASAYRSMAKMKKVNPRIMEMRERLKGNPQQMQQEMMKIYREEKVNPLGGCFPILIQIPVFIALYWVLMSSVEMRNSPWIGWITDLSTPDPFYILPLIMAITTILQTALNPLPPDPLQAKLMWMMPVIFSVMFFFFPAGLVLYWITNNILTIAQQAYINHQMGVPLKFNMPNFKSS